MAGPAFPLSWQEPAIQLPYDTEFDSIWEYQKAFDTIEWDKVLESLLEDGCPCCGQTSCMRALTPYRRGIIELFPAYREGFIWIARFLCRSAKKTFSLLPIQLTPYCRYTNSSMLLALLMAEQAKGMSLFAVAEKILEPDSRVHGCTLAFWLSLMVQGFRRNHAQLNEHFDLRSITPGKDQTGYLHELAAYCKAVGIRGPPKLRGLGVLCKSSLGSNRFLFGVASQYRNCGLTS